MGVWAQIPGSQVSAAPGTCEPAFLLCVDFPKVYRATQQEVAEPASPGDPGTLYLERFLDFCLELHWRLAQLCCLTG